MTQSIYHPRHEQALVQQFFGGAVGTFVEVGANDPIVLSQSFHLERLGWTGILVEPIPEYAQRLRSERTAAVFEGACGAREGVAPFTVAGIYSSLLPVEQGTIERVIHVRVRPLDAVLQDAGLSSIDLLSIDVEGCELEVMRGFSLARWRPRLILIEDPVGDLSRHRYLSSRGYKLVRRTGLNAWYVPTDFPFPLDVHGRWQLLRKYVLGLPIRKLRNALRRVRKPRPTL